MTKPFRSASITGIFLSAFLNVSPVDAQDRRYGIPSIDEAEHLQYLPNEEQRNSYYAAYDVLMDPASWVYPENRKILKDNLAGIEAFERRETYVSQLSAKIGNPYNLAFEDMEDGAAYLRAAIDVIKSNYDEVKLFELMALRGRYYFSIGEYEKSLDLSLAALSRVPQESLNENSYPYVAALAVSGWAAFYMDDPDSRLRTLGIARDSFKTMSEFRNPYLKNLASYSLRVVYGPWRLDSEPPGFMYDLKRMYKSQSEALHLVPSKP
jgi:tetratricopeptide (TPR) repeat protein